VFLILIRSRVLSNPTKTNDMKDDRDVAESILSVFFGQSTDQ
jgi:hypothetical protein